MLSQSLEDSIENVINIAKRPENFPSFNRSEWLAYTLDSVLEYFFKNFPGGQLTLEPESVILFNQSTNRFIALFPIQDKSFSCNI